MELQKVNLFGDLILPEISAKEVLNKINTVKEEKVDVDKKLKSKKISLEERLKLINDEVDKVLGKYKSNTLVIRDKQTFINYIDKSIENGIIAIDTETNNSLDALTCKLMGLCIYTPGLSPAYVPINHKKVIYSVDADLWEKLENQLTEQDCKEQLSRLKDVKILTHNGKFDYKVLHCTCGWDMPIYWDSYVAARLLDENEISAGLKQQYIDKIDPEQEKYDIEHLFTNVLYEWVDPDVFALYSATDALMTYKLYEWQLNKFNTDKTLTGVWNIFRNIEIPLIEVVAKIELEGIDIDQDYAARLSQKYHKLSETCDKKVEEELNKLTPEINKWKLTPDATKKTLNKNGKVASKSKLEQLSDPISLESPTQLAILLYDILKAPQVSLKSPRGTGVDELNALYNKTKWELIKLILEKRGLDKLINTFIDKLPNSVSSVDGRVHCELLPLGTDTGRFSSSNPNLQQVPRADILIKPMFKAPDGYSLICCDLSAAEVRTACNASKDPDMIRAYQNGQDLYSLIASKIYNNKYEDNLEFYPEGTKILLEGKEHVCGFKEITNKAGKTRRQDSKSILIGLIYGRGVNSICEQINETRTKKGGQLITKEDAQKLVDNIYKSFPRLKKWMEETHQFIHENGYIDDVFGRRRRLPDGMLPRYTIKPSLNGTATYQFNPLLECEDRVDNTLIDKYTKLTEKIFSKKDYEDIKKRALVEGIEIHDNTGYISQAERQSVNFQAQAASSDINKMSMIAIDKNEELKALGVQLLLTIHDEVMVKCPSENAEAVSKIIPKIMINVGKDKMSVPLVADATIIRHWYEDDLETFLNETYNHLLEDGMSSEDAINKLIEEHYELLPNQISEFLTEGKPLW